MTTIEHRQNPISSVSAGSAAASDFTLKPEDKNPEVKDVNGNGVYDLADYEATEDGGLSRTIEKLLNLVENEPHARTMCIGNTHGLDADVVIVNFVEALRRQGQRPALCLEYDGRYFKQAVKSINKLSENELQAIIANGGTPTGLSPKLQEVFDKLHKANVAMREEINGGDASFDTQTTRVTSEKLFMKLAYGALYDVPVLFIDHLEANDLQRTSSGMVQTPYRDGEMAKAICEHDAETEENGEAPYFYVIDTGYVHAATQAVPEQYNFQSASLDADNKPLAQCLEVLYGDEGTISVNFTTSPSQIADGRVDLGGKQVSLYPFRGQDPNDDSDNFPFGTWEHVYLVNPLQD